MQLKQVDEGEERRVSVTDSDQEQYAPEATLPQLQANTVVYGDRKEPVGLHVFAIAGSIFVMDFTVMFAMQFVMYLIARGEFVSGNSFFWREGIGLFNLLVSVVIVGMTGYLVGLLASRRAIAPGIIAGHVVYRGIYYGLIFPRVAAMTRLTMPTVFWTQTAIYLLTAIVTEIVIALLVSRRRGSVKSS